MAAARGEVGSTTGAVTVGREVSCFPAAFTMPVPYQFGHRVTLLVEPGRLKYGGKIKLFGVPYGARARMILLYLQTHAIRTSSREPVAPFPVAARQTGHADFPHPAFSRPIRPSLSARSTRRRGTL